MSFHFEKLLICQKSVDFADQIWATTGAFSRGYSLPVDQLSRVALSI
jgi:hypothetical protein